MPVGTAGRDLYNIVCYHKGCGSSRESLVFAAGLPSKPGRGNCAMMLSQNIATIRRGIRHHMRRLWRRVPLPVRFAESALHSQLYSLATDRDLRINGLSALERSNRAVAFRVVFGFRAQFLHRPVLMNFCVRPSWFHGLGGH